MERIFIDASFNNNSKKDRIGVIIQLCNNHDALNYKNDTIYWRSKRNNRLFKSIFDPDLSATIEGISCYKKLRNALTLFKINKVTLIELANSLTTFTLNNKT